MQGKESFIGIITKVLVFCDVCACVCVDAGCVLSAEL